MFSLSIFSQENTELKKINIDKSRLFWIGEKTGGSHEGYIQISHGEISVSESDNERGWKIIDGSFIIDMGSIDCIDLQGGSKKSIEKHLKNEDFFDTQKYPESKFEIIADNGNSIEGFITIKDIRKKIKFDYKGYLKDGKITIVGDIIIDRTDFNINYKSSSIFPEFADNFIYDEFTITLEPMIFE
jgi:polyisoprenoid-binding protein YceI